MLPPVVIAAHRRQYAAMIGERITVSNIVKAFCENFAVIIPSLLLIDYF